MIKKNSEFISFQYNSFNIVIRVILRLFNQYWNKWSLKLLCHYTFSHSHCVCDQEKKTEWTKHLYYVEDLEKKYLPRSFYAVKYIFICRAIVFVCGLKKKKIIKYVYTVVTLLKSLSHHRPTLLSGQISDAQR